MAAEPAAEEMQCFVSRAGELCVQQTRGEIVVQINVPSLGEDGGAGVELAAARRRCSHRPHVPAAGGTQSLHSDLVFCIYVKYETVQQLWLPI